MTTDEFKEEIEAIKRAIFPLLRDTPGDALAKQYALVGLAGEMAGLRKPRAPDDQNERLWQKHVEMTKDVHLRCLAGHLWGTADSVRLKSKDNVH